MRFGSTLAILSFCASVFGKVYFHETFDDDSWEKRWVQSSYKDDYGKFVISNGKEYRADPIKSRGLQTSENAKFYAISAPFDENYNNKGKDLVVQFSVRHEQKIDCGGGYIKILPPTVDPKEFNGESPYNIVFGSDICGASKKTHLILSYKGKNHLINKELPTEDDVYTHLYTLIIKPDQTYTVLIDNAEKASGTFADWDFLEPKTIPDPEQSKPTDWVDDEYIDDPNDKKPDDWDEDEPQYIDDPEAEKPEDWDDDMDGEWEAPKSENPKYKGKWTPKKIKNPDYKGKWVHPEIPNPDYVDDKEIYVYDSGFVGIDLWQVKAGSIFDDIVVTDDVEEAKTYAKEVMDKIAAEKADEEKIRAERKAKMEEENKKAAKKADEMNAKIRNLGKKDESKDDDSSSSDSSDEEKKEETKEEEKKEEEKKEETKEEEKKEETKEEEKKEEAKEEEKKEEAKEEEKKENVKDEL
ncbi:Calreticulin-domain-containing protein [Anaeromyces robustus]|uniref:Calreticulin-domain-containing protein n=1 Tax=Anaeromyces robustus TaxID=1754192 RepID=A0A1Y1X6Z4_9FUNG|nr:Calreticulin-domain-containing protein [Anaeromyces robustus]|eukprot:ORX81537.1 Calreticulin-domain-containing protein [Anaeromyces robustus]